MKNLLILYASSEGQTEKIAQRMAETGRTYELAVSVLNVTDADAAARLESADGAILGASVHVGSHQKDAVKFVRDNLDALEQLPSAFFSVSMAMASGDKEGQKQAREYAARFMKETGWNPDHVETFAGALAYRKYGIFRRFMMRMISKNAGGSTDTSRNHEYTDWDAVDKYVESFASSLS